MDTIMIIRDTVATCVNKTAAICPYCARGSETSDNDVVIVMAICGTILIISFFITFKYFKLKADERATMKEVEKEKRDQAAKDRKEEKKAKLQNDLLSFLKDNKRWEDYEKELRDGQTI